MRIKKKQQNRTAAIDVFNPTQEYKPMSIDSFNQLQQKILKFILINANTEQVNKHFLLNIYIST